MIRSLQSPKDRLDNALLWAGFCRPRVADICCHHNQADTLVVRNATAQLFRHHLRFRRIPPTSALDPDRELVLCGSRELAFESRLSRATHDPRLVP